MNARACGPAIVSFDRAPYSNPTAAQRSCGFLSAFKPPVTGSLGSYGTAAHCLRGASWQIPIVIAERRGTNNRELKRRGRKVPTCHLKNTLRKSYSGKRGVVSSPNVTQLQFPARCLSHSRCD